MNTRNTKTKLLIGASLLTAVLCAGCSGKDDGAPKKAQEQQAEQPKKPVQEKKDGDDKGGNGLRVDPLGKFTTPGRCIGWTCF